MHVCLRRNVKCEWGPGGIFIVFVEFKFYSTIPQFKKKCNFNKYSNFIFHFSKNACQSPMTQPSKNSSAPQETSTGRYSKCTHQSNTHTWIKHAITAATLKSIPSTSSKRIGNYTTYLYTNYPSSLTSQTSLTFLTSLTSITSSF